VPAYDPYDSVKIGVRVMANPNYRPTAEDLERERLREREKDRLRMNIGDPYPSSVPALAPGDLEAPLASFLNKVSIDAVMRSPFDRSGQCRVQWIQFVMN